MVDTTTAPVSLLDEVREQKALRLPSPPEARRIRMDAEVSQARMAAELGVTRVTLAQWENGRRHPRGELRKAYAALLEALRDLNDEALAAS